MTGTQQDEERGRRLASRRNEIGLSQQEMADKIGVHRNSVIGWEKGTLPQERFIPIAVKAYKLPEDFFFSSLSDFEKRLSDEVAEMKTTLDKLMGLVTQNGELARAAEDAAGAIAKGRRATDRG